MVKNIKLDTYFFKEYEKIVEKNTYSAYVPNGNKGIWSIASYNEGKKKKNSNFEKINLAQIGVRKTIEKYFENNDFSIENMEKIMKNSSKKVIFEKMNLEKNIENLERIESESLYSQLNIMIDKDNIIVGNSGKTAFILYRGNKIFGKISEEEIKNIKLEKNDYLLAGSPEFWEVIDENELTEIHIDKKSKESVERNLSEKIKKFEKKINKVIPFFSIFVEEIENIEENNLEDIEKDSGKIITFHSFAERRSESTKHIFRKGDLLYSKLRPYLNKVVIAPKGGFCTSEILPLNFNGVLLNEFAQRLLMSFFFLSTVNMLVYGVKMPRLGRDDAKKIFIPIPPISEQKRIVAKIEEIFNALDDIQRSLI